MVISLHQLELIDLEDPGLGRRKQIYFGGYRIILIAGNFKQIRHKACEICFIFPFSLSGDMSI